ncbi:MAG: HAD hydrolase-like protein [Spirochaetia bacterium]|jgi:phosphoglycolate phosphatase
MNGISVVFDLDGTLLDSATDIVAALDIAVVEAGVKLNLPISPQIVGPPIRGMLARLGVPMTESQVATAVQAFRRAYDDSLMELTQPYPGAAECLRSLVSMNCGLYIATIKPLSPTQRLVDRWFSGLFRDICCVNSEANTALTKPRMLQKLSRSHGLSPTRSVMVGDGPSDIRAGRERSWRTVAVLYGYGTREELIPEQPDAWAESTAEIPESIQAFVW